MTEPTVVNLEESDRSWALATLTLAFASDPVMRWLWAAPHRYATLWPRFAEGFGGPAIGHGTAHGLADGRGAALWLPPGSGPNTVALGTLMAETLDERTLKEVGALFEQMDRWHPSVDHWYLALVGVDPILQGRGLGSTLLRHGLTTCDRDRLPAYLEASSPRSRDLYERLGFEVVGMLQAGSSPPLWAMLREPELET